jgi:beta-galactosidase
MRILAITMAAASLCASIASAGCLRQTVSLDGTWQIAEGSMTNAPATFDRTVPVPGLVDMAVPAFVEPGPKVANRETVPQKDPRRDAFWYRRTFKIAGKIPPVAVLQVNKAFYGTRMFLNGQLLGDHAPICTLGIFDAKPALKTGENELIIRVGADRDAIGRAYPDGFDFEKSRYIPGIFDSVKLILTGTPHIENVQVAPDIANQQAKVRVYLAGTNGVPVEIEIREAKSGRLAGKATTTAADVVVPIANCRLWSPEDPFLYKITVRTSGDEFTTRFGMREFRCDPATRRAVLNGKPYYMRGSNITLYRFFEDPERGAFPWNDKWVRKLHQRVKGMHWNCLRYCIGFPPEKWYEIADETGILIQDEFLIWYGDKIPSELRAKEIAKEYAEWMNERWNHPCVVIWDASNETYSDQTAPAIRQVRSLDLSNRPWDNSYTPPLEPSDCIESHPYHFQNNPRLKLDSLATANPVPWGSDGRHAVIINEYGWLWVNRDGTPTTLTRDLYTYHLGPDATPAQRFHMQATWLAADTEFWRAHRQAAAVMHFTTLGYSRPDGQTSDHWKPGRIAQLEWEPEFYRYVRDAFAPVGLMIDHWKDTALAGRAAKIPVILINDLDKPWSGPVTLRVKSANRVLFKTKQVARIAPFGTTNIAFVLAWPQQTGAVVLEVELRGADGDPVHSTRDVMIRPASPSSLATGCAVTASSVYQPQYRAENAVDGDADTYWSSKFQDDAWLKVDLGASKKISRVNILWETAYAKSFFVQVSTDGEAWTDVYKTDAGQGGMEKITFSPVETRYVRIVCVQRATQWGDAIRELEIFP